MRRLAPLLLALLLPRLAEAEDLAKLRGALVEVNVAAQSWDTNAPWQKRPVQSRTGQGIVVRPGTVLTLARLVDDAEMVEVSVANSARRYPARVKHIDENVGLALVEITDEGLRASLAPLPVGEGAKLDDEFDLYQLGGDNVIQRYTGRVVSVSAVGPRLLLRLNTTLPGGGEGQAAIRDGKLLGLVSGTGRGQEGTLVSVETIRRYLDDLSDGVYEGAPAPGLWTQPLLRDDLRAYYGVGPDQHGIAVTRVMPGRTGDGVLQENDVLLSLDGYDLDDEGRFQHEVHGRLDADYLLEGRHKAGESIRARILRTGKVLDVELPLRGQSAAETLVPDRVATTRPEFLVAGGLLLMGLTKDLNIGRRSAGALVLRRYVERAGWDPKGDRKQIVFVDHVLPDIANKGFETLSYVVVETVNGQPIRELADVAKALEKPSASGFHVFRFEGVESDFVIPAAKLDEINRRIARHYGVTELRYLAGDEG
jgi:S1-C subfamily serine protease